MKAELESIDFNQVWELVEPPKILNPLAASGSTKGKEDRTVRWKSSRQGWWLKGLLRKKALIMRKPSHL